MTIEEAIDYAKEQTEIFSGTHGEFLDVAIAAMEKQIPKKVGWTTDYAWGNPTQQPVCPVCDYCVTMTHFIGEGKKVTYCDHCGNALDWSDAE